MRAAPSRGLLLFSAKLAVTACAYLNMNKYSVREKLSWMIVVWWTSDILSLKVIGHGREREGGVKETKYSKAYSGR